MTGYGKHIAETENTKIIVEIRTLNSKQLDVNMRLPSYFKEKEIEMRKQIAAILHRGKIDIVVSMEQNTVETAPVIDIDIAKHYHSELKTLATAVNQGDFEDYLSVIVKMPEIFVQKEKELEDEELNLALDCMQNALIAVDKFRISEGEDLLADFTFRCNNILSLLDDIDNYDKERIVRVRDRILSNLKKFLGDHDVDKNRLEQEMIYYIEKLDITEEQVRLRNNCRYFLENLNNEESSGKKLGFICQEIGREINTLGSKANDADVQRIVVLMKDELEKIKEQLFNIL